ncbi:MAG TPA: AraC family transcriptional regulator [Bacilli bacterium]
MVDAYGLGSTKIQNLSLLLPIIYYAGFEDRNEPWEFPEIKHKGKIPHMEFDSTQNHYVRSLPYHLLVMVVRGSVMYEINGESYVAEENMLVHLPSNTLHHIRAVKLPMRYVWVHYQLLVPEQSEYILPLSPGEEVSLFKGAVSFKEVIAELPIVIRLQGHQMIRRLMNAVLEEVLAEKSAWILTSRAYFQSLLMLLYREVTPEEEQCAVQVPDPHIAKVIEHIHSSFASKLTVEGLAVEANLSLNYFISSFKKCTGFTPGEYISRVRIQNAKKLIRNGMNNLSEITYLVGFESVSYFSRVFKKIEGLSPSEFKHTEV